MTALEKQFRRRLQSLQMCHCHCCVTQTLAVLQKKQGVFIVVETGAGLRCCLKEPEKSVDLRQWIRSRRKK